MNRPTTCYRHPSEGVRLDCPDHPAGTVPLAPQRPDLLRRPVRKGY